MTDTEKITQFIRDRADHPMRVKEIARALDISEADYADFRKTVKRLIDQGVLVKLKRGRVGVAEQMNIEVGQISITRKGDGYLLRENTDDVYIPSHKLLTALDGDKVMVRVKPRRNDQPTGRVLKIVERAPRRIVGIYREQRHFQVVKPDSARLHRDFLIPSDMNLDAKDGEKVVIELVSWDDPYLNPLGKIVERLGFPTEPGVDMLTIIRSYNLPDEFPSIVQEQAEKMSAVDLTKEFERRLDLTDQDIYTIDPADAKDHDDAVSVTKFPGGYRLGVHIADVSFFVEEGSELDTEAFTRGNSVYLPGMVIPMLPEVLSNDVCSLKPNRKRLAHSVFMEFDETGKMTRWEIEDTVIKSRAKLAYEEVQAFFDGTHLSERAKRVTENLTVAKELASLLTKRRLEAGSLDFDLPEAKIILNDKGEVIELGNRVRLESHRLVEEFMLAANRAVALEVSRKGQAFIYRVHARPDMEKLEAFSDMMDRLGYRFPVSPTMHPDQFRRLLEQVKDEPEADFVNELMLRSMQKAVYQRENIGHFGLAFKHYTHFTSPIRRYPDLLVHRLLRKLRGKKQYEPSLAHRLGGIIDHVGKHCSETERHAETAEREAIKTKQASYMVNHVGEQFSGVITGVTSYGFFVRLDNLGVEGLVRLSAIDDDYYQFDEPNFRIIGRRHHRSYRLGDAIVVGVMRVEPLKREIDLYPVVTVHQDDGKTKKKRASSRPSIRSTRGKSKSNAKSNAKKKPRSKSKKSRRSK